MGTGVALSELLSVSFLPLSRGRLYKRSNLFNKGIIIGREQQFLCKPVGILLTVLTGHRLPSNLTIIISDNFRKAQVFHLRFNQSWIKEYGQASRPISTD